LVSDCPRREVSPLFSAPHPFHHRHSTPALWQARRAILPRVGAEHPAKTCWRFVPCVAVDGNHAPVEGDTSIATSRLGPDSLALSVLADSPVDVSSAPNTSTRTYLGVSDRSALARIIHGRGRERCWDEPKCLGQRNSRACLMLKGPDAIWRPGSPPAGCGSVESASELTVRLTCAGSQRSSSDSSLGRKPVLAGRRSARLCGARFAVQWRSQEVKPLMRLLSGTGLRDETIPPAPERRPSAGAWPGR
jgi:hypothetical protein